MPQSWNLPNIEKLPGRKARKWNNVADRLLRNTLTFIDQKRYLQTGKLDQDIRNVQRQLDHYDHEKQMSVGTLPRAPVYGLREPDSRLSATPDSAGKFRVRSFSCVYSTSKKSHKCQHFPCNKPNSYHTIGYRIDPENTEWIPWVKLRNSLRDSALSAVQKSVLLNTGVSRLRAERREAILKMEMEKRRKRAEEEKPPSWEINYGKPSSIRRLKYPVRMEPLSI